MSRAFGSAVCHAPASPVPSGFIWNCQRPERSQTSRNRFGRRTERGQAASRPRFVHGPTGRLGGRNSLVPAIATPSAPAPVARNSRRLSEALTAVSFSKRPSAPGPSGRSSTRGPQQPDMIRGWSLAYLRNPAASFFLDSSQPAPWPSARAPCPRPPPPLRPPTPIASSRTSARRCCGSASSSSAPAWVAQNFITDDTEALDARANQALTDAIAQLREGGGEVRQGRRRRRTQRRQLDLLKVSLVDGDAVRSEGSRGADDDRGAAARRRTARASGARTRRSRTRASTSTRSPRCWRRRATRSELRDVWEGWHTISPPMRKDYARFVELSNKGAKELGFADTGAMWRAKYDMPPDAFTKELDRLWDQVRPLYLKLHAYVRMKLREKYGDAVPANGPIPAHLLGNIWAQDWSNVYPLVAPPNADAGYSLDRHPQARKMTRRSTWCGPASASTRRSASRRCRRRSGSARCSSGRAIARSSATPARGTSTSRTTCASRCASSQTAEDFTTIHHELGHNFYQRAYKHAAGASSATAPTTASTRRSATRSRCR